jgi:hypothetical protein
MNQLTNFNGIKYAYYASGGHPNFLFSVINNDNLCGVQNCELGAPDKKKNIKE